MSNSFSDKAKYDLSIEYAKISLTKAIADGSVYDGAAPANINEMDYLLEEFFNAYDYYTNCIGDVQIKNHSSEN